MHLCRYILNSAFSLSLRSSNAAFQIPNALPFHTYRGTLHVDDSSSFFRRADTASHGHDLSRTFENELDAASPGLIPLGLRHLRPEAGRLPRFSLFSDGLGSVQAFSLALQGVSSIAFSLLPFVEAIVERV